MFASIWEERKRRRSPRIFARLGIDDGPIRRRKFQSVFTAAAPKKINIALNAQKRPLQPFLFFLNKPLPGRLKRVIRQNKRFSGVCDETLWIYQVINNPNRCLLFGQYREWNRGQWFFCNPFDLCDNWLSATYVALSPNKPVPLSWFFKRNLCWNAVSVLLTEDGALAMDKYRASRTRLFTE